MQKLYKYSDARKHFAKTTSRIKTYDAPTHYCKKICLRPMSDSQSSAVLNSSPHRQSWTQSQTYMCHKKHYRSSRGTLCNIFIWNQLLASSKESFQVHSFSEKCKKVVSDPLKRPENRLKPSSFGPGLEPVWRSFGGSRGPSISSISGPPPFEVLNRG